jgi:DNA-binding protein HU-beta
VTRGKPAASKAVTVLFRHPLQKKQIFLLRHLRKTLYLQATDSSHTTTLINKHMAKALSKSQIAAAIAEKNSITKKTATEILEFIADLAYKNAKNTFTLPGLGKLVLVNRKARMGRNPATGEAIKIAAKRVVKFRVAKAAKDAILGAK